MKDSRKRIRPALIVAACAAAGLCFAARAQQQEARPGETPPIHDPAADEGDEPNPDDLAAAVKEAQSEPPPPPSAEVMEVPAAATNAVTQHIDHP